jgi:hypothetical protein
VPALGPGLAQPLIEDRLASVVALPEVGALVLFGSRACGKAQLHSDLDLLLPMLPVDLEGWCCMPPEEDARLILLLAKRHESSLAVNLDGAYAQENWGFLAQQCVEKN